MPIWVGGRTARSLRRATELADGWCPFGLTVTELSSMLAGARERGALESRDVPFEVVLQAQRAFDPIGEPQRTTDAVRALGEAGATIVAVRLVHRSPDHYVEQMAAMSELVGPS